MSGAHGGSGDGRSSRRGLGAASLWTDSGFVLLTGPAPWWQDQPPAAFERFVIRCFAWVGGAIVVTVLSSGARSWAASAMVAAGLAVFVLPALWWTRAGTWPTSTRPAVVIPLRLTAAIVAAVGFSRSGMPDPLVALATGMFLGIDAALSLRGVGHVVSIRRAARRFALSGLHVGVVLALSVDALVSDRIDAAAAALRNYVLLVASAAIGLAMVRTLQTVAGHVDEERTETWRRWQAEEHRRRAHWIHDDVCADLRYVRIQVSQEQMEPHELGAALDDLDHRLRLRQLDELVATGSVRVAEVVQPFVRTLQDRGVRILDVPGFDVSDRRLSSESAQLLRRVLAVLVANALHAGTTSLAIRCRAAGDVLHVEVEDDAGGFDLATVPAGRGLDGLRQEVGASSITVASTGQGSMVSVRMRWEVEHGRRR